MTARIVRLGPGNWETLIEDWTYELPELTDEERILAAQRYLISRYAGWSYDY
jgi:hypothetical protein